jgi:acetyltransferase-like isoleucine patch superfamily enzyme
VVTRDVPPYTVVGGAPARVIKAITDEEKSAGEDKGNGKEPVKKQVFF